MSEALQQLSEHARDATRARELLKERARALARPIATLEQGTGRSVVVFSLAEELYAIETRFVHTIQRVTEVFPLPGAAAHVLGLTNLQGELLVVFDVRVLLGVKRQDRSDATRMLVLGDKHPELAIVADAVHDVQPLHDHELFPLPASTAEQEKPYLSGITSEAVSLFDATALLGDPQMYVDEHSAGLMP